MKKPGLNKISCWTLENQADHIIGYYDDGQRERYIQASQFLVDLYIPEGWRLDYDDIDQDVFVGKVEAMRDVIGCADTILSYHPSCNARELVRRLIRPIVREFKSWLKHEFDLYGKEAK